MRSIQLKRIVLFLSLTMMANLNISNVFGASDGVVYFSDGDSASCRLFPGSESNNTLYIIYSLAGGEKVKAFPNQIKGYKTTRGEIYYSRFLTHKNLSGLYFCNTITSGRAILFTAYLDGELIRFIEIDENEPVEIKKGKEINVLSFLFRDCPKMKQEYIKSQSPEKLEHLALLTVEYANCNSEIERHNKIISKFEMNKMQFAVGLFVGYENASIHTYFENINFGTSNDLVVGFNGEFTFGRRLGFLPAISYTENNYERIVPYPFDPQYIEYEIFHISRIQAEFGVRYYLMPNSLINTYLSLTPVTTLFPDITLDRKVIRNDGYELPINDDAIEYYTVGIRTSLGFKIAMEKFQPFTELRYSYELVTPVGAKARDFILNSFQLVVGISFKF